MASADTQTFPALGSSMHPFIPGGSRLTVRALVGGEGGERGQLSVGDVIGFLREDGIIAHRVLGIDGAPPHQILRVRGDGQASSEAVPLESVAFVVTEVDYRGFRYRLDGPLGILGAAVATRGGIPLAVARRVSRLLRHFLPPNCP